MRKYDWKKLSEELHESVELYGKLNSIAQAVSFLKIPYGTIYDAFERGDLPADLIKTTDKTTLKSLVETSNGYSFRENGNEAVLKFKSAEPLSAKEVAQLADVDEKEWRIADQRINMWQMGRKHKIVDMSWSDGKASGFVDDDGTIKKEYLYQIEVKFTRIKRIAVKLETLKPIEMKFMPRVINNLPPTHTAKKVLFITDPHFGFRRNEFGKLVPIHHRRFIGSLLGVAAEVNPDVVVWNGDVLDLADFSTFDTAPELLYTTQMAGLELAWILGEFRNTARRQVVLEGNHEKRMDRMLIKHFSASYQLKPVHELDGEALMSVPRFLGLDKLYTEWVGGYPANSVKINTAKFTHGDIVRKGSAKTVSALMTEATGDRFFGHIHRFEIAAKYIEDLEREIWVGSPGCACDKRLTPGADIGHNWQLGAFLVHCGPKAVLGVEHISSEIDGTAGFRGRDIPPVDYMEEFLDSIPEEYRDQY